MIIRREIIFLIDCHSWNEAYFFLLSTYMVLISSYLLPEALILSKKNHY